MATPPRFFEDGGFYHVYNRGNRRQQIFLYNRDYDRFLEKVLEYKKKYPLTIHAYCLMPNHFHFLIQQRSSNAISSFMSDLCNSHTRYFNVKYELVGSIFQGRFKAKKVDKDEYSIHLSRYIHLNPVDLLYNQGKDLFEKLLLYKWSSLPLYIFGRNDEIATSEFILNYFSKKNPAEDYKAFVACSIQLKVDPIISDLAFDE